jgi:hypothetical protein
VFASLALVTLAPAAPVPKDPPPPPPPVVIGAKRFVFPPQEAGGGNFANIDDGHFIKVTILNTSKETLSFQSRHELTDLMYTKVTDEKGVEVSRWGHHLRLVCGSLPETIELKPGETISRVVHLLRDWPHSARRPGKYTARVVFAGGKVEVVSEAPFEIEIAK